MVFFNVSDDIFDLSVHKLIDIV